MPVTTVCVNCGSALPEGSRKDARFCGVRCRVAAHRAGHGSGPRLALPIRTADGKLWCPSCARGAPFGRLVDGALVLIGTSSGGFARADDGWRWSIYGRGDVRAPLPATVLCPRCREALAVDSAVAGA